MELIYKGIDVSRWQGDIDWNKVKADGIDFAMIRLGYCGYAGEIHKDVKFDQNIAGAAAAGVHTGVYVYSYAQTADAARIAAEETLAFIQDYTLTFPVAFDIEDAINVAMTREQNTAIAQAYLSAIAAANYLPMVYTYKSFAETKLDMDALSQYDFWLAHVTTQTGYTGAYTIWQYSWTGTVDGISGDVDLNNCYKDYPAYIAENNLNGVDSNSQDGEDSQNGNENGDDNQDGDNGGDTDGGDDGEQPDNSNEDNGFSYVVVKNDTLSQIAQRYGIPLRTIIQANPQIKNPNLIYVGDIIHIPAKPMQS